jgi:two-component system cell cycle sensor histidine kinase/response regulator CckA
MIDQSISLPFPNFRALFEAAPGLYLVLLPDAPRFTIVAVSNAYLRATMTERAAILGCGLFEVFPDNPNDAEATGVHNLKTSLNAVLELGAPNTMAVQKYDIRRPESEGGGFVERFWSPVNSPVFGANGEIAYLLHRVEDVTEFVRLDQQRQEEKERYAEIEQRANETLLRAEGLQEANSHLRKIITERQQAETALRETVDQFRATFEQAAVGIAHVGLDGQWLRFNRKFCEIVGYTHEELSRLTFRDITHPDDLDSDIAYVRQLLAGDIPNFAMEKRYIRKDGAIAWINVTVSLARYPSGEPNYYIRVVEDITARKRLEDQLLQAQKLESIGRLAGGVAHDFNNLLTAILGYGELIEEGYSLAPEAQEYLHNITQAAHKAARLTGQLLAFARRQIIEPKVVNLNDLILNLNKMLRRLIGEHIELVILPEEGLHPVKVDPGQFEQILVNLVVNARDAMPDGGKIIIETHNATLDEDYSLHHEGVMPGDYAVLAISDTGSGMEEAIRLHIFEPFFTTKEKGRGTGLGLSTVYGIVKQAGGHIWLYSEPGAGTTFKIYLPHTSAPVETLTSQALASDQLEGSETILLVEDEPSVRALASQALRGRGYTVLAASNGEEALRLVKGRETEIALLVTDVVMPQMNGKELADRLQAIHPALQVLFASGYTENTIVHHGVLEPGVAFLSKPFTPTALARKIREGLDRGSKSTVMP